MRTDPKTTKPAAGERGFTLIEVLVVVAIIGMLTSIMIPALEHAMYKAKRNAAISDLKLLRGELEKYAADKGAYPLWGEVNSKTLSPLTPRYLPRADVVMKNLWGNRLHYYVSWNFMDEPFDMDAFISPKSFLICAQLKFDPDTWFYVTDGPFYLWEQGKWTTLNEELK